MCRPLPSLYPAMNRSAGWALSPPRIRERQSSIRSTRRSMPLSPIPKSNRPLPIGVNTRVDVVIVGGGIIGTSRALFLARKGVSVALCEKGHMAHEQSSRNWGWCRKMARDPRELPLAIESLRIWEGMNEMVEAETGFRTSGIMYLAETQADLARFEDWLDHARQ